MKTLKLSIAGSILIAFGYMIAQVEMPSQRVLIAEQAAQIVLLEHIVSSEIPRIREEILGVEERFIKCNEIAARMGVMIDYSSNESMGGVAVEPNAG